MEILEMIGMMEHVGSLRTLNIARIIKNKILLKQKIWRWNLLDNIGFVCV